MKRFPRFRKFVVRAFLVLIVALLLGWWFENWRGARAWEQAQKRATEAGVSLLRADYAGPEIPDDENLLNDPIFSKEMEEEGDEALGGWRWLPGVDGRGMLVAGSPASGKTVEYREYFMAKMSEEEARVALAKMAEGFEARLGMLAEVILAKPEHDIFAKPWATGGLNDGVMQIMGLQKMSSCFQSSGLMAFRSGDSQKALKSIQVLDRLSRIGDSPGVIDVLIGSAVHQSGMGLIWEGIRMHAWSEEELNELSVLLLGRDFREPFLNAIKYEMAWSIEAQNSVDEMMGDYEEAFGDQGIAGRVGSWLAFGGPSGWDGRRKAFHVETYLDLIEMVEAGTSHDRIEIEERCSKVWISPLFAVGEGARLIVRSTAVYEQAETFLRIALINIALEREFLNSGVYPGSLSELDLQFSIVDLTDPESRDLAFELGPEGRPQVWSRFAAESETTIHQSGSLRWQFWTEKK